MSLNDSKKRSYAWEFLRRSPEYQSFWNDLCLAKQEADKRHRRVGPRVKLRGQSIESREIMREFNIRALKRWCLNKIYDWQATPSPQQLKVLFAPIRPVTEFYSAPWEGDPRLYLAIDSHGPLKEIKRLVLTHLNESKKSLQLPLRDRKKPREGDYNITWPF